MKKTVLFLMVCCLIFCISCAEKPNGIGSFDLSNAKNLYIGSVGTSKGIGSDFGEVTKDNHVKKAVFSFDEALGNGDYKALPDKICQLNNNYILVKFGVPLVLVNTTDGSGICINHINWQTHPDMTIMLQDEATLKRQFKINEAGDVYYLRGYLSSKKENLGDMTGFSIMKYDRREHKLVTFFTYDSGKMRGGSNYDSLLVDAFENTAATSFDGTNNDNSILVAVPKNGSPVTREYPCEFRGSFIDGDGVFYFLSGNGYVSIKYDSENISAELSDLITYPYLSAGPACEEYVLMNGKVYGLSKKYSNSAVYITTLDGTISNAQPIAADLYSITSWDCAGDYIYISGRNFWDENLLIKIDTKDNSVSEVITDKEIESFTASEKHGITFVSKEGGSYSLWVQDVLTSIPTMIQESTEAFQDLVKVD